jgi:hypothetical protein
MELQELVQRIERWKSRQAGDVVPEPEEASVMDEIEAVEEEAIAEEVEAVAMAEEAVPEASIEEAIEVEGEEGIDGTSEVSIEQIEAEVEEEP